MKIVMLCALGVGGSTLFGALVGILFKNRGQRVGDGIMSVAAGIMLAAAMLGLILPSLEYGGRFGVITTVVGIFFGAFIVHFFDFLLLRGYGGGLSGENDSLRGVIIFVMAIAVHNLPEGVAAGVGFGTGDVGEGIFIATAIALQNIPEGMAVILALGSVGMRTSHTLLIAALTGVVEVLGSFIGYFAAGMSRAVLPFILAAAGGSMLYVISDELIPEYHSRGEGHRSAYLILSGFCLMLILNGFL